MSRARRLLFWAAFIVVGVALVVTVRAAVTPWSLQSLASAFGYRGKATGEQVAYGRKWCAGHYNMRLASIYITYTRNRSRFSPALALRCTFQGEQEPDVSAEFVGLTFIDEPDDVPSW